MTQEVMEESMMNLNMPFKEQLSTSLTALSDTDDAFDRWLEVQLMWTSLDSVLAGGGNAKAMPMGAKQFQQIDEYWVKIMQKSTKTKLVVPCCQNDMLKQVLPVLAAGLEACQMSLGSYLEGKRNKSPRPWFFEPTQWC